MSGSDDDLILSGSGGDESGSSNPEEEVQVYIGDDPEHTGSGGGSSQADLRRSYLPSKLPSELTSPTDEDFRGFDDVKPLVPINGDQSRDLSEVFAVLFSPDAEKKSAANRALMAFKPSLKKVAYPVLLVIGAASPLVCIPLSKDAIEKMLGYVLPDFIENHPFVSYIELGGASLGTLPLILLNTTSMLKLFDKIIKRIPKVLAPYSAKNGIHWYNLRERYDIHGVGDALSDLIVIGAKFGLVVSTLNSATSNAYFAATKIPPYFWNWTWLQLSLKIFTGTTGLLGPWANNYFLSLSIANAIAEQRIFRKYVNPFYRKLMYSHTRYNREREIAAIKSYLLDMNSLVQNDLGKKERQNLFNNIVSVAEIDGERQVSLNLNYLFSALAPENFGKFRKAHTIKYAVNLLLAILVPSTSAFYYVRTGASAGKEIVNNEYVDGFLGWTAFANNLPILWYVAFPVLMSLGIGSLSEIACKYFWSLMMKGLKKCRGVEANDQQEYEKEMLDIVIDTAHEDGEGGKSQGHGVKAKIVFTFKNGIVRPVLLIGAGINATSNIGANLTATYNPLILGSGGLSQFFLGLFGNNAAMKGFFGEKATPKTEILRLLDLIAGNVSRLDDQYLEALYNMLPDDYKSEKPRAIVNNDLGEYEKLVSEDVESCKYGSMRYA